MAQRIVKVERVEPGKRIQRYIPCGAIHCHSSCNPSEKLIIPSDSNTIFGQFPLPELNASKLCALPFTCSLYLSFVCLQVMQVCGANLSGYVERAERTSSNKLCLRVCVMARKAGHVSSVMRVILAETDRPIFILRLYKFECMLMIRELL